MPKVEKKSSRNEFAKGGGPDGVGLQHAGTQKPGQSAQVATDNESGIDDDIEGGDGKMFGPQYAGPQKEGTTAHDTAGSGGKWAKGGTTKMFGLGKANTAEGGQSAKSSQ